MLDKLALKPLNDFLKLLINCLSNNYDDNEWNMFWNFKSKSCVT